MINNQANDKKNTINPYIYTLPKPYILEIISKKTPKKKHTKIPLLSSYNTHKKSYHMTTKLTRIFNLSKLNYFFKNKFKQHTEQPEMSRSYVTQFLNYSNTCNIKHLFYSYNIVKITCQLHDFVKIENSNKTKLNNIELKQLIFTIKSLKTYQNKNANNLITIFNKSEFNFTTQKMIVSFNNNKYLDIKKHILNHPDQKLIGPIINKNHYTFFKIIDTKFNVPDTYINFKTRIIFINKNNDIKQNNNINHNLNLIKETTLKTKNYSTFNDMSQIKYINKQTDASIYLIVKKLKKNELSAVLEMNDGWYLIQHLENIYTFNELLYINILNKIQVHISETYNYQYYTNLIYSMVNFV